MARSESDERAELLAWGLGDFERFCRGLVWIVDKDKRRTTLKLNPIQRKYCARRTWRDRVLKPRQIGFSTLELARDVWKFLQPGQTVIVVCQTDANSTYLKKFTADVERMFDGLERAGLSLDFGERASGRWSLPKRDSFLQIIESGASEQAASKKGRGGTYSRVHSTEAAFYEHPELSLNALLEGVPDTDPTTEVVFESTPNGVGNWFHTKFVEAQSGIGKYKAHFFPWFDDPTYRVALLPGERFEPRNEREQELVDQFGITPEQLKWYRAKVIDKGQDLVDQEYASDPVRTFLQSGRTYFDTSALNEMAPLMREPIETALDGRLRTWKRPKHDREYVIGADTAEGLGEDGDWSVASVWDRATHEHVATLRSKLQPNPFADDLVKLARQYEDALVIVERNKGMAVISAMQRIGYQRLWHDQDEKPGFATTSASRPVILEELAHAVRDRSLKTDDPVALAEMRAFVVNPRDGKPYAPGKGRKDGASDDWIFSAALAWRAMQEVALDVDDESMGGERNFGREDEWSAGRGW